jgi:hypothetical protein
MITNTRILLQISAVCLAVTAAAPTDAQAQVTTVINYSFNVPIAKVVPNPCTGGFTLVNGTLTLAISAVQQTAFQLTTALTSSGTGKDVTAAGLPLIFGAGPDYQYSSDGSLIATFPDGIPTYFEGTLPMADFLVRNSPTLAGDSYMLRTVLRLKFNNGIPSAPLLESINVACE